MGDHCIRYLEGREELQEGFPLTNVFRASLLAALDDGKQVRRRVKHAGLLCVFHGLPSLLLHQALQLLNQGPLFGLHIDPEAQAQLSEEFTKQSGPMDAYTVTTVLCGRI